MSEPTPERVAGSAVSIGPAFLFIIVAAIASGFVAIWGVQFVSQQREKTLLARVDSLRTALGAAPPGRVAGAGSATGPGAALDSSGFEALRAAGLANPVRDLETDLRSHPELIPYPATLGGTMGFYSPAAIRVLDSRWVYARFEDGHQGGAMLLEYHAAAGRIHWRRVAASMD